jgi:hypothetical protein
MCDQILHKNLSNIIIYYMPKDIVLRINVCSTLAMNKQYWIKLHQNNQYTPHEIYPKKPPVPTEEGEWQLVKSKKKKTKYEPIYYWVISDHNLCEQVDHNFKLFFTDVDMTHIEAIDQNNYMALDQSGQLKLIHIHLKHKGMKMTPTYFIAKNSKQIEEALQYVKYCLVKTTNNEQTIINPTL